MNDEISSLRLITRQASKREKTAGVKGLVRVVLEHLTWFSRAQN